MLALLTPLGGCMVTDRYAENEVVTERFLADRFYTRAEIDAINAESQCRLMARNLVQVYRCGARR